MEITNQLRNMISVLSKKLGLFKLKMSFTQPVVGCACMIEIEASFIPGGRVGGKRQEQEEEEEEDEREA